MSTSHAMLGMYDPPALRPANDALWEAIRRALGRGPRHLSRDMDFWQIWQSPGLLFAQTCGYPYRAQLHGAVHLIGTPDYGLPGCPPALYCSVFVARDNSAIHRLADCDGRQMAFNEPLSQSGWAAPQTHLRCAGYQAGGLVQTGSHAGSAAAVARGDADFAALDLLTWLLLKDRSPECAHLKVIDRTAPTPGLPYITALAEDPAEIASAVQRAIETLSPLHKSMLHLKGLVHIPSAAYLAVSTPPTVQQTGLPLRQL